MQGEVTVEVCVYEVTKSKIHRISTTSIPLQSQVCCHSFSPDNEKLMLGCIDGSVILFDESRGITHSIKAAFVSSFSKNFLFYKHFKKYKYFTQKTTIHYI